MKEKEFNQNQEFERCRLTNIELPNLIHKILHLAMLGFSGNEEFVKITISEIKKITNIECDSILSYLENNQDIC